MGEDAVCLGLLYILSEKALVFICRVLWVGWGEMLHVFLLLKGIGVDRSDNAGINSKCDTTRNTTN